MNWDYIIVGAGSAGCAVAYELVRSGSAVLLLEAGGADRSPFIKLPAGLLRAATKHDWKYHSAPDATRHNNSEAWYRGRVIGGSSSVNGMIYVRGSAADYDRWAHMGNYGWQADSVMPIFKSIEQCDDKSIADVDRLRGRQGTLHVRRVMDCHPVTDAFIEAVKSLGYEFNTDYNGASQGGAGYTQMTQRGWRRWSAADAFLKPVLDRENLKVVTNAHVHRVLIKESRAVGVVYDQDGMQHEAHARRVIVCGGAINTPKLLMLSGVGDAAALVKHGIAVVLDRKSVGQGLMEHPMVRLVYRMRVPTYNPSGGLLQNMRLLGKYLVKGQGPLASPFEAMAFLKTSAAEPEPDVQLHFSPVGIDAGTSGAELAGLLSYPSVFISVKKNYPLSRGRIRLTTADPNAPPLIEPNLLASQRDVDTLIQGIATVRRIMAAAPMATLVADEVRPGAACVSPDALANYVRHAATIPYHPVGTCRMGADDSAVVTPELQVRGIENLWIADASIMPHHISGNTNAACMMIGTKLGRKLAAARG